MTIPDYQTLMLPVLDAAREGEAKISDVIPHLADVFKLTPEERAQMLPSGRITLFANRVHWAKTYLKQAGLVEPTRRAYFRLTKRGSDALTSGLTRIDNGYLSQFPEFLEFKMRSGAGRTVGQQPGITIPAAVVEVAEDIATPDETMRSAHQLVVEQLQDDLLDRVITATPEFFERLIVDLLVAMGFGGSIGLAGRAIGRSGDGGVDGIIDQDALGLDRIYIQAKRYAPGNNIGASAIRDFFGSLDRFKAAKGVFVSTSAFTKDARDTAESLSKRIVLIDGERLGELMVLHNVGCRIEETLHVKKVDEDFFLEG